MNRTHNVSTEDTQTPHLLISCNKW